MPRRTGRFDVLPPDMAADVLSAAGAFRDTIVRGLLARVRPFGPSYCAALLVLDAIDGLAEALTGNREHFHLSGSRPDPPQAGDNPAQKL